MRHSLTRETVLYPHFLYRHSLTYKWNCTVSTFSTGTAFSCTWHCTASNSCTVKAFSYTWNCTVSTSCTHTAISYKWNCTISTTKVCRFSNCKLVVQSELGPQWLAQLGYSNLHWLCVTRPFLTREIVPYPLLVPVQSLLTCESVLYPLLVPGQHLLSREIVPCCILLLPSWYI